MRNSELNAIAERMLTEEFVGRLFEARNAIERSFVKGLDYGDEDLARDLDLPLPVARILMSFTGATAGERKMRDILARNQSHQSEASH